VVVNDVEDILAALNYGSSIRQTDATAINARSSRSHAVFSLSLVQRKRKSVGSTEKKDGNRRWTISGVDTVNGEQGDEATVTITSKLHFVDLAGSERLKWGPTLWSCLHIETLVLKVNARKKEFLSMRVLPPSEKSFRSSLLEMDTQHTFLIATRN
jgi:Kinesin motor domain